MYNYYSDQSETENYSTEYVEVLSQLQQLEKQIRKFKKKKGGIKKGKKRKLKKRIKNLELECAQMEQFMLYLVCQYKMEPTQQSWWQGAICNTLPKAFELATATINKLPSKTQPLYLIEDGN